MGSSDLRRQLETFVQEHPEQRPFADRIESLLDRIQSDFDGDTRAELEQMVGETLVRQLELVSTRRCTAELLQRVEASHRELLGYLYDLLLRLVPDDGATRH